MSETTNILLILTDQHRLSAVGAYGPTPCRTPNIDRLAAEGVLFENAYTTCPVCTPARSSVLTGEYPHTNGMRRNEDCHELRAQRMRVRTDMLPHRLKAAGYQCGYNGKWHLGDGPIRVTHDLNMPSVLPSDVGFEGHDYGGHGDGGQPYADYKDYLKKNGWSSEVTHDVEIDMPSLPRWGRLSGPTESSVAYYLTSNTIDLLDRFRGKDKPWFMWHNYWGPHEPHYASSEYVDHYRDVSIPEWPNFRMENPPMDLPQAVKRHIAYEDMKWEYYEELIRHYYAMTTMIDDQIGRLIADLEAKGELENTVIILTADHGETLGSHAGLGDKGWHHFDEIQRIPFIVRLPESIRGNVGRGAQIDALVSLTDVYSTVLDIAGVDLSGAGGQGRSLLPLMREPDMPWRDTVGCEFWGLNGVDGVVITIRSGNLKYGWNSTAADELYDLASDPHELCNLAHDPTRAKDLAAMRVKMRDWMQETDMQGAVKNQFQLTSRD